VAWVVRSFGELGLTVIKWGLSMALRACRSCRKKSNLQCPPYKFMCMDVIEGELRTDSLS